MLTTCSDKDTYFDSVDEANSLQERFKQEANVDVLDRVATILQQTTGLETRIAHEGDKKYFAGLLRVVDKYIQIHADYGLYVSVTIHDSTHKHHAHYVSQDGPGWEIGNIAAQLTWNILLKQIPGGETIIYDRQWQGRADDIAFQKAFPRYAYAPSGVQGYILKALSAVEGDLTFFNPR
jgi:hypothetical protein